MKKKILGLILFTVLLCMQYADAQTNLAVCNLSEPSFTPINQQQYLSNIFSKEDLSLTSPFVFIQFNQWPNQQEKTALEQLGTQFIQPYKQNTYLLRVPNSIPLQQLKQFGAHAILPYQNYHKVNCEAWTAFLEEQSTTTLKLYAHIDDNSNLQSIRTSLEALSYVNSVTTHQPNQLLLDVQRSNIDDLINVPAITYLEPGYDKLVPLNFAKARHGIHYVQQIEGLTGAGVTVGVGDNGKFDHVDGRNRTINKISTNTTHGNNICGLIAGSGIVNPKFQGYAPKSKVIAERFDDIIDNASVNFSTEGMVITNNAYGTPTCSFNGWYSSSSRKVDDICMQLPEVLHVFAAGNTGFSNTNCGFKGCGFGSVLGGYQTAKNALMVGNLTKDDVAHVSSGKGPTRDGRLKPEICARGHQAVAPGNNNRYNLIGGTSAASTAVSGGAALLIEQYKNQHNSYPPNHLIKSVLCNTATDIGNPGPDFIYGFGQLNLKSATTCLKNNHYFLDSIINGQSLFRSITVPQNTKELRVNLYWNDISGPLYSSKALIDDIDLQLLPPGGTNAKLPLILDADAPDKYAMPGRDSINNIEQIVISNPASGLYLIKINGTSISSSSVNFALSYSFEMEDIKLFNPVAGATVVPGETFPIFWDALDDCYPFKLEYSLDNGGNWDLIADNIDPTSRMFDWDVSDVPTAEALLRLTQNGQSAVSGQFNVYYDTETRAYKHCSGNAVRVAWDTVPLASGYEIWLLDVNDTELSKITTVQGSEFVYQLANYQTNEDLWFSVKPIGVNNELGRRSVSVLPVEEILEEPGDFHYNMNFLTVDFFGFARPPSNQSVTYNWQFGDGAFATGTNVMHNYNSPGQYYVKLIVLTSCSAYTIAKTIFVSNDNACLVQDSLQLIKLYNQTDGANWTNPWSLNDPVSTWSGVYLTTDKCRVQVLQLTNRRIIGKMPILNLPELQNLNLTSNTFIGKLPEFDLPKLQKLYVSNNSISDTLPHLNGCQNLEILSLDNNELSGSIPSFNLPDLTLLLLDDNRLSGPLPSFSGNPKLTTLNLAENRLEGSISNFNLPMLENLHLNNNRLTGPVPDFNNLPNIKYLYLNQNELHGTLPSLVNCPELVELFGYSNNFSGSIPKYSLAFMTSLYLQNNDLTGPLPNFDLPLLQNLFLYDNQLSGTLPHLDSIPFISKLNLSENELSGTIPRLTNAYLTELFLHENKLSGKVPDLSGLSQLADVTVYDNYLTFAGQLQNDTVIDNYLFAPQGKLPVFTNGNVFSVVAGGDLSKNTYEWFRNGELISTKTGDSSLVYSLPGTYYCKVTNADITDYLVHPKSLILFSEEVAIYVPVNFNLKVLLEGPFNSITTAMDGELYLRSLLRGQQPGTTVNTASPTPSAHPYQDLPWGYLGSEGGTWNSTDYNAISSANGNKQIIDWVLVSLRTTPAPSSTVARTVALLFRDGSLHFPDVNFVPSKVGGPFYILVEHRNHMGAMTPNPVPVFNDTLTFDFTLQDSYASGSAFGSKEIQPGLFVMHGGEGYNTGLKVSYDINGNDKSLWLTQNGVFSRYIKGDFNMDGDVNGADRIIWDGNNGIYSSVKRYYP